MRTVAEAVERIDRALSQWAIPSRATVAAEWIETHLGLVVDPWQRRVLEASFRSRGTA